MADEAPVDKKLLEEVNAAYEAGEPQRVVDLCQRVLQNTAIGASSLNRLGLIAVSHQDWQSAGRLFARSLSIDPTSGETFRYLGHLYAQCQDYEKALIAYGQALRLNPADREAQANIESAKASLQITQDPDYALISTVPWNEDDWIWEELHGNPTLFVLFSGLGVGNRPPTFVFSKFLTPYAGIDKLFIRDLRLEWYLTGLGSLTSDVESTASLLRDKISNYQRTVFIGTSAGGMAAILYGQLLQVDKILAFAPQTVLTEAKEKDYGDTRWEPHMKRLRAKLRNSSYLDLANINPYSVAIDIHHAAGCQVDSLHAGRLKGERLEIFAHEGTEGHLVALQLRDQGQLKKIIDSELK